MGSGGAAGRRARRDENEKGRAVERCHTLLFLTLAFSHTMLRQASRQAATLTAWGCQPWPWLPALGGAAESGARCLNGGARNPGAVDRRSPLALTHRLSSSSAPRPSVPTPPRFLVTGAGGQIGVELCRELRAAHGAEAVVATDARPSAGVAALDVTDGKAVADGG
jgi:hypothetical protein